MSTLESVIDIRGNSTPTSSNTDTDLISTIINAFSSKATPFQDHRIVRANGNPPVVMIRSLPTMILYSDKGLDIFDKITYSSDYYLTASEINILKIYANDIIKYINDGDRILELGCGSMRKTKFILEAIVTAGKQVTYHPVDLSESSLKKSMAPLISEFPSVKFMGLWGTYNDSLHWVSQKSGRNVYLWLGSSIGNFSREEAVKFITRISSIGMKPGDIFLCGIDRRNSFDKVSLAYNDSEKLTRDFIFSGLEYINKMMNSNVFNLNNFEYVSIYNEVLGRHEAYLESIKEQDVQMLDASVRLLKRELINIEYSVKYSSSELSELTTKSGLNQLTKWTDSNQLYDVHLFYKPAVFFSREPAALVPSLEEFEVLFNAWDNIVKGMIDGISLKFTYISDKKILTKPISLRHPYIFYFGHLPAFIDIQLSKCTGEPLTPPLHFAEIFERGIGFHNVDCRSDR